MKAMKIYIQIILLYLCSFTVSNAQVGINASGTPPHTSAMLDVSSTTKGFLPPRMTTAQRIAISTTATNNGLMVFDTDTQSLWIVQSAAWLKINPNPWSYAYGGIITTNGNNRVGIGTTNPLKILDITHAGNDGLLIKSTAQYQRTHLEIDGFSGGAVVRLQKQNYLQWLFGTDGFNNNNFRIYNISGLGQQAISISKSTNNMAIGNGALLNKFEIGDAPGFSGNELALGNGTQGMSFSLNPNAAITYTNTNFSIMPNGSTAYLGIGTTTPIAPLHVTGYSTLSGTGAPGGGLGRVFGSTGAALFKLNGAVAVSILAEYGIITKKSIMAFQNITASDARIKNIIDLSDNQEDLEILKKIEVTNYQMKDKVTWGEKVYKKVIAQQLESVYPEAIQKTTSFIPDIYILAEKVEQNPSKKELKITLPKKYEINVGEKIQLIHPIKGEIQTEVIAVLGNSFTINNWEHQTDKIFVFGREVNDFRTVDYEALSTLSISATQQLAKKYELITNKMSALENKLQAIESRLNSVSSSLNNPK
jgi:division protein CdvB (Snf7/Vps24/ESCRT-III family)